MAKKEEKIKTVLERTYNVPLRREFQKVARWRRTEKASKALREFISKHMKSDNVIISNYVNQYLWKDGIKRPPHHVKVNAVKDDKGNVKVELVELSGKSKREQEKLKAAEKKKEDKEKEVKRRGKERYTRRKKAREKGGSKGSREKNY